jgi:hypothetical protein
MQMQTTIPARFNGPPASGNGGYSCGLLAAHIAGPACIRLHVPPPLDTALRFTRAADGVEMYDGDTLVASGKAASLQLDVPNPPTQAEALAAMDGFPCYEGHDFPTCFVCGPEREAQDGLDLFPGPVPGTPLWACLWRPAEDLLDAQGNIRPEILWSALDCPGYFAAMGGQLRPSVLGELTGELRSVVAGAGPLIVYAWPLGGEGRKFHAGTAIASGDEVVASARSTWITLKPRGASSPD